MKQLLEDLFEHAGNAFFLNAHDSDQQAKEILEDYSEELEYDLDALPEKERERYEKEYRTLFKEWLTFQSYFEDPLVTGHYSLRVKRVKRRRNAADKRFWQFREWRESTLSELGVEEPRYDIRWPGAVYDDEDDYDFGD